MAAIQFQKGLLTCYFSSEYIYWGINIAAIEAAMRIFDINGFEKREMLQKITAYADMMIQKEM